MWVRVFARGPSFHSLLNFPVTHRCEPNEWLVNETIKHEIGEDLDSDQSTIFHFKSTLSATDRCKRIMRLRSRFFSHASRAQIANWLLDIPII